MARIIRIAAAQVGAVHRADARPKTLIRLISLLQEAASKGAEVVLFPECTFTTFFPRHFFSAVAELESFFEHGDVTTAENTRAIFEKAKELGVDICIGFAEATDDGEHYNTCVYYHAKSGSILSKYRKIHLPGDFEPFPDPDAVNQLEKRYFKPGNLGFHAFRVPDLTDPTADNGEPIFGMMICNDRRWAEAWRCLGLQGVEVVFTGYNTPGWAPQMWGISADQDPKTARAEAIFHHKLVMQAHSYTNACFSVSAARCGLDDGKYDLVGGSTIVGPDGKIIAETATEEDEVIVADCDLDLCSPGKKRTFDFGRHRRVEHYSILTSQTGVVEPPRLSATSKPNEGLNRDMERSQAVPIRSVSGPTSTSPIRILLCNPNSTEFMTSACLGMVRPTLPPDVIIYGFTASKPAPSAIEGNFDNVMSAAAAARAIIPIADQYDAFLVACYSDHALIKSLREELSQPVIGIMEASLLAARTLGGRFGIIATSRRSRYKLEDSVRHYGLESFCAGVRDCNLGVLELESKPEKEVLSIMCEVGKLLVEDGADVLTLGCAGMTNMKTAIEQAVGEDVQVVDGVVAGIQHLVGLCRMGTRTAKRGMYASSAKERKLRGQDWY
ncbi:carbon-nitrogen hydrolase [Trematosphaeria pertusa]|uniref:Carbon-nitrogen hydrolase n=1 Tax=Trematosphaeria pertusa TaxID=390896 RepID=A0A6A6IVY3_9PLEO|nr:carbon-nitrogen hydrolase [Trematosphaeria pertusa]KAF2254715.1 carbon-nitrogen hydrolase [Trematosphaeria pertusa]